jgi:signal transduction histidine kinase
MHLFERFYRGRSAAEAGQAGSGLGLFTARGIARMHGGEVRRLEGDTFELELPLTE